MGFKSNFCVKKTFWTSSWRPNISLRNFLPFEYFQPECFRLHPATVTFPFPGQLHTYLVSAKKKNVSIDFPHFCGEEPLLFVACTPYQMLMCGMLYNCERESKCATAGCFHCLSFKSLLFSFLFVFVFVTFLLCLLLPYSCLSKLFYRVFLLNPPKNDFSPIFFVFLQLCVCLWIWFYILFLFVVSLFFLSFFPEYFYFLSRGFLFLSSDLDAGCTKAGDRDRNSSALRRFLLYNCSSRCSISWRAENVFKCFSMSFWLDIIWTTIHLSKEIFK